jgi:hypothetical protein
VTRSIGESRPLRCLIDSIVSGAKAMIASASELTAMAMSDQKGQQFLSARKFKSRSLYFLLVIRV